jgi:hypothetical protein
MRDLANIVEEQGKDIEQVETNVTAAEDATEKGVGHLTDAEKYQKGSVSSARARALRTLSRFSADAELLIPFNHHSLSPLALYPGTASGSSS